MPLDRAMERLNIYRERKQGPDIALHIKAIMDVYSIYPWNVAQMHIHLPF